MKPPPFELRIVTTLDDALQALADVGDEGRPLAGGQSLIPLLNFRLAHPEVLVDLRDVDELRYVRRDDAGGLRIGAMTTMSDLIDHPLVLESHPVLRDTITHIAHEPIRNRGTIGGSLAHMDPAAEMPALALLLDAELEAQSVSGSRTVAAADFVRGAYTTALETGELLTEIRFPALPAGARTSVLEVAQRAGDFALAGAACVVALSGSGDVRELRSVVFGSSVSPTRLTDVESAAVGAPMTAELALSIAQSYADGITPVDDRHGSAGFRRHLTKVMVTRAVREAAGLRLR
jgi:CO/xanthine dehydrogenase FAD-binding subunit